MGNLRMLSEVAATGEGQIIVVKIGGNSIAEDLSFLGNMARQLRALQIAGHALVLIHGGGPQIDAALRAAGITPAKGPDGRRLTDAQTMDVVARTMRTISLTVVTALQEAGCAVQRAPTTPVMALPLTDDGDRTGRPALVERDLLLQWLASGDILVLNSVGYGVDGLAYNINADDYALAVAASLQAKRLILVTNVMGVWDADKKPLPSLTPTAARALMAGGVIKGGMIPKVESALAGLAAGIGGIAIIDGHRPDALTIALTKPEAVGTLLVADKAA